MCYVKDDFLIRTNLQFLTVTLKYLTEIEIAKKEDHFQSSYINSLLFKILYHQM